MSKNIIIWYFCMSHQIFMYVTPYQFLAVIVKSALGRTIISEQMHCKCCGDDRCIMVGCSYSYNTIRHNTDPNIQFGSLNIFRCIFGWNAICIIRCLFPLPLPWMISKQRPSISKGFAGMKHSIWHQSPDSWGLSVSHMWAHYRPFLILGKTGLCVDIVGHIKNVQ